LQTTALVGRSLFNQSAVSKTSKQKQVKPIIFIDQTLGPTYDSQNAKLLSESVLANYKHIPKELIRHYLSNDILSYHQNEVGTVQVKDIEDDQEASDRKVRGAIDIVVD
jgi:hypothetical protein